MAKAMSHRQRKVLIQCTVVCFFVFAVALSFDVVDVYVFLYGSRAFVSHQVGSGEWW